jgi:hypothetical protein
MSDFKKPSDHYRDLKKYVSASHGRKHICMVYSDKEQQITALSEYFRPVSNSVNAASTFPMQ